MFDACLGTLGNKFIRFSYMLKYCNCDAEHCIGQFYARNVLFGGIKTIIQDVEKWLECDTMAQIIHNEVDSKLAR